jgi:hypothetical protein
VNAGHAARPDDSRIRCRRNSSRSGVQRGCPHRQAHVGPTQPASGRFAMIDDGIGLQPLPWRPVLDQRISQHIGGVMRNFRGSSAGNKGRACECCQGAMIAPKTSPSCRHGAGPAPSGKGWRASRAPASRLAALTVRRPARQELTIQSQAFKNKSRLQLGYLQDKYSIRVISGYAKKVWIFDLVLAHLICRTDLLFVLARLAAELRAPKRVNEPMPIDSGASQSICGPQQFSVQSAKYLGSGGR